MAFTPLRMWNASLCVHNLLQFTPNANLKSRIRSRLPSLTATLHLDMFGGQTLKEVAISPLQGILSFIRLRSRRSLVGGSWPACCCQIAGLTWVCGREMSLPRGCGWHSCRNRAACPMEESKASIFNPFAAGRPITAQQNSS